MSDLRMELIQGQLNDIEENVRSIKATWGNTIMALDNIKTGLKADRQKAIEEAYQKGLDDAWECAKRIVLTKTDANCRYFTVDELEKIFGCSTSQSVFSTYSASGAIEKVKAYEIKVGDELQANDDPSVKIIVSQVKGDTIWGFNSEGTFSNRPNFDWHKTGRHFPQVAELLNAMKGGTE